MEGQSQLEEQIHRLQFEIKELKDEMEAIRESPFLQSSIKNLKYEVVLDRKEVISNEIGHRINEKHGTMYEIKQQAKRFAHLLGLDADMIRILVTEALQNILEHGTGRFATVHLEIRNDAMNPCMMSTFKHEIEPGMKYTLSDINENALKGDITSAKFDFESSRGRGEFIMKQLTDERRILNGIEVNRDGKKVHYFKRILINYKNPSGPRERVSFREIKEEIDRLDYEDVVCCFHVDHTADRPDSVTIATTKAHVERVAGVMSGQGFRLVEQEPYYRTVFATYVPTRAMDRDYLLNTFSQVKAIVYQEVEARNGQ